LRFREVWPRLVKGENASRSGASLQFWAFRLLHDFVNSENIHGSQIASILCLFLGGQAMERCQNCKHSKAAHSANGCSCGCVIFQPANAPLVFNSIKAGEEIMQQIEAIRRQRSVSCG
jgi:hypothetical protein